MSFDMANLPPAQAATAGLAENECYPKMLIDDPSFALINSDPYFRRNKRRPDPRWANAPDSSLTTGKTAPPRKRDLSYLDPGMVVLDNGNVSRISTPEELGEVAAQIEYAEAWRMLEATAEEWAYVKCQGDSCATQLTPLVGYISCSVCADSTVTN